MPTHEKRLTIRDIARLAGVSHTTVSRVLNSDPRVRPQTAAKVLKVVADHRYRPSALARQLARGHSRLIGLMVSDISNPFYAELARAIEDNARNLGYLVIICSTDDRPEVLSRYVKSVVEAGIDGLIIASVRLHDPIVENLIEDDFPLVMVNRRLEAEMGSYVVLDNFRGAYRLTRHLIENGYRKIAMITGPADVSTAADRLQGYLHAMKDHGIPLDRSLIHHVNFTRPDGFETTTRLMSAESRPEAIFGGNDNIALGAMDAVRKMRLRVPEDVALVGFDDTESSREMQLTTVSQKKYKMGDLSVKILIRFIEEKSRKRTERIVLEPDVLIRKSTLNIAPTR
jgi:DNA-binding LacI/PurR family transcriptional regulator